MHSSLTDAITCPRCGPQYGLILVADKSEGRRILDGFLGCANCREQFSVRGGFGDLRFGGPAAAAASGTAAEQPDTTTLAALLGVTEGPALVLLVGAVAASAPALADLIEGIEVVAAWPPLEQQQERQGVSRFAIGDNLPFRSGSMRGVALSDAESGKLIEEAARVAAPRARVVAFGPREGTRDRLERCGLRVLAQDERVTVAERGLF